MATNTKANWTSATLLKPNTTPLTNDYTISSTVLGTGISGGVVECTSKADGRRYALKRLVDSTNSRREVDLHWRLSTGCGRHIVRVVDVYENPSGGRQCLFVVMELMEGGELFDRIKERNRAGDSQFTEREAAKIVHHICKAVHYLHGHGIAHRDIKPENLLYTSDADDADLKLADFGFAKETSTRLKTPCYTPYYASPEVLDHGKEYDEACDLWSIGVVMYILLCGYPPFTCRTKGALIDTEMKNNIRQATYAFPVKEWAFVSDRAKDVIRGLLKPDAKERPTVETLMEHPWIAQYSSVPATPLGSLEVLSENQSNWSQDRNEWENQMQDMRITCRAPPKLDLSKNLNFVRKHEKEAKEGPEIPTS